MTSADRPLGDSTASPEQEHSVSSGIATVSGGLAGAMIGQLVGGRLGAAIGAVVGGVAGATMGKEAGDTIHHAIEVSAQQVTNAAASIGGASESTEEAHPSTPSPTVDQLYEQGLQLSQQGNLSAAIAAFQSVVAQEPESAEAHYNLGIVLGKQGFRAQGIEQIEQARDLCRAQNRMREAENIDRILEKLNA